MRVRLSSGTRSARNKSSRRPTSPDAAVSFWRSVGLSATSSAFYLDFLQKGLATARLGSDGLDDIPGPEEAALSLNGVRARWMLLGGGLRTATRKAPGPLQS